MMNLIIKILVLTLFLIIKPLAGQSNDLSRITKKYNPYLTELNVGISILVKKDGQVISERIGTYNFNEHTVFNIGSATKKITALLILQEQERGNLKLSDSIATYLKPMKNVDGSLTIESLLRHRSGLGEIVGKGYESDFFAKNDSIYNQNYLARIPEGNPNKRGKYQYCNTNYLLLGKILEKVTDKNYFDLVRERIFIPASMDESYPYVSKNLRNLAPPTYKGKNVSEYLDYRFFANFANAAGAIASTLSDMKKFYTHLFEKQTFINTTSLAKLTDFDDADYGLGMMKFKNGTIGHGGNNLGYAFKEYYNPETKDLVLFFSNSRMVPFNRMIKKELFDYLDDKVTEISFNKNITSDFKKAVGKYLFDSHGMKMEMEIVAQNDHLYFTAQGAQVILISKEKNKLFNGSFGVELEVNPKNPNELIFRQNGLQTTIKRI